MSYFFSRPSGLLYSKTLIRTLMHGLEESVLIGGVSLLEGCPYWRGVLIGGVDLELNNFQIIDDLHLLLL